MSTGRGSPFEIRVRGHLDDRAHARLGESFGALRIEETVLCGEVADPSQLQGVVALLEDLGCELLEVRRLSRRRTDGGP